MNERWANCSVNCFFHEWCGGQQQQLRPFLEFLVRPRTDPCNRWCPDGGRTSSFPVVLDWRARRVVPFSSTNSRTGPARPLSAFALFAAGCGGNLCQKYAILTRNFGILPLTKARPCRMASRCSFSSFALPLQRCSRTATVDVMPIFYCFVSNEQSKPIQSIYEMLFMISWCFRLM